MKKLSFIFLAAMAAATLSVDTINAQTLFLPSGTAVGTGGVGVGANPAQAPLDVIGNNMILRPSNTFNPNGKFIGIGESGGVTTPVNGCNLYGFRAQRSLNAFINVGIVRIAQKPVIGGDPVPVPLVDDIPTISWGSDQPVGSFSFSRPLDFRYDNSNTNCGSLVARMSSTGTYRLIVYGSALASGGMFVDSDARFKQDIEQIQQPLDLINQLEGTTYMMDTDNFPDRGFNEGMQYGFIAQELQKVMPSVVKEGDDGFLSVNYDAVVPVLVEGIKAQQGQLEEARQTNESLQEQLDQQDAAIQELQALVTMLLNDADANKRTPANIDASDMGASDNGEASALYQNRPNPVTNQTEIPYFLPTTVNKASLVVYSLDGREVLRFDDLTRGNGQVRLQSADLPSGNYVYRLIADNVEVGSKKIIVSK